MNLIKRVRAACENAFYHTYPELQDQQVSISVTKSTKTSFGHYQCNSAMALAKSLQMPPRAIATEVVEAILVKNEADPLFSDVTIAGPGFINLTLLPTFLASALNPMLADERLAIAPFRPAAKVVVDFSSPNTAKEMHVGHLRSTIIGDALARVLQFLGQDVLRLNHIGDWGTAFGMLIAYLKAHHLDVYEGKREANLTDLVGWYKAAKKQFDADDAFKKTAQLEVVALQNGDSAVLRAWQMICEISRRAYQDIYDLLQVDIQERGESFYNPMLVPLVRELDKKGIITDSFGAKCVFLDGFINREGDPLPFIIQKSDGGFNYATTDIAALKHRVETEQAKRIIYVTDNGQVEHFKMLFAVAEKAGIVDANSVSLEHVPFGLVLNKEGKKFKTRAGHTERLIDLLTTATTKARKILEDRKLDFTADEMNHAARVLGIGAVKYADLSCDRINDYTFSYDKMLRFEGNTAAFILYAYVRTCSILRRAPDTTQTLPPQIQLTEVAEIALALKLCQFHESLESVAIELMPNRLTDYLFTLAERFNAFFRDCQVIGSKEEISRLQLCQLTGRVLKTGLNLLGIDVLNRM